VLHLISDHDGSDGLAVESRTGVKLTLSLIDLRAILQGLKRDKCRVKLVVLMFPNSTEVGKVFQEFGVDHVITFDCKQTEEIVEDGVTSSLKLNYMHALTKEFFAHLVKNDSVRSAL